ncbi:response regulator [Dyadobacter luteus]|jgi:CheY-like chemotaxis protein|uniref:Response regulator n=1 Tax=Dyadobacter luteus TaxID=2259619 RepID=A0A3D8YEL5_9BACT|nr:response regulator [Dyadobacter luteus]REA63033.1 response regulator [Dyadobacter luteus]
MKPKKDFHVLLVEDDIDDQQLIEEAFQDSDLPVHLDFATDGRQALDMLSKAAYAPDLILLDLNMPVMNGFEVLSQLQLRNLSSRTPVVILTTSSDKDQVNRSYDLGASSYIVKPRKYTDLQVMANNLRSYWFQTVVLPT